MVKLAQDQKLVHTDAISLIIFIRGVADEEKKTRAYVEAVATKRLAEAARLVEAKRQAKVLGDLRSTIEFKAWMAWICDIRGEMGDEGRDENSDESYGGETSSIQAVVTKAPDVQNNIIADLKLVHATAV